MECVHGSIYNLKIRYYVVMSRVRISVGIVGVNPRVINSIGPVDMGQ